MKIAVILIVAMVMMMMSQEAEGTWRRKVVPVLYAFPGAKGMATDVRKAARAVGRWFRRWGKREVREAEFDAAFNAAAEDGILSDDEILSVLGVSAEELAEFKQSVDMDGNGEISVAEYIVATIASEGGDNGQE